MAGPYKLVDISDHIGRKIDVLICSASFEERCKSIPINIDSSQTSSVLVCENIDLTEHVGGNAEYLREYFSRKSVSVSLNLSDPLKVADSLDASIKSVVRETPQTFVVDTTTFTRESLLILLRLLRIRLKSRDEVIFTYANAAEYSFGQQDDGKWLSKGIRQIRSVLGYPGDPTPSRKFHLLVMAGFEHERAVKLIESYESAIVSVGFGDENQSITHEHFESNLYFHNKLCSLYQNIEAFTFSLVEPLDTKDALRKQIQRHPGFNVVVAPLNNKISTLGAALAAFDDPNIQLCYAQANQYNFEFYSQPGDDYYMFEIPNFVMPNEG